VTLHQDWRDFICDPGRPARFLSSIGRGIEAAQDQPVDAEILAAFLDRLAGGGADVELLANAIDLAHGGYAAFCTEHLPHLLDALANERLAEDAVVGPALRGNPRWDRTMVARRTGRIPRTHFVSRLPARSFDLPENVLVRWLLDSLSAAVEGMALRVGSAALPDGLLRIREAVETALSHRWFREVTVAAFPTEAMFAAASRQRLPAYRIASGLARRRAEKDLRRVRGRWFKVFDFLRANWLSPVDTDDLFELFALALVLDVLEVNLGLGPAREYGLALRGRDHVALYDLPGGDTLRVFFDQSPRTTLAASSQYQQTVLVHHGLTGSARRPDVTLVRKPALDGRQTVMFIEVKETGQTRYASDSIYKAFGYLQDFSLLWGPDEPGPRIVLLFPADVAPRAGVVVAEQDVLLLSSNGAAALGEAIRSRFHLPEGSLTSA
jgi:hypothetical protein